MNLIERKREEHRSRILQRIGSVLVCMSVLLAVAFPPQEAKAAFVADDMAVAAVASAFLASCGMTFRASGMDSNGVKEQVGRLIDQYISSMDETHYSNRIDWLFGDGSESFAENWKDGCLIIKAEMANKLVDLGWWVKEEYSVEPGEEAKVIFQESSHSVVLNGRTFSVCVDKKSISRGDSIFIVGGTRGTKILYSELPLIIDKDGRYIDVYNDGVGIYNYNDAVMYDNGVDGRLYSANFYLMICYYSKYNYYTLEAYDGDEYVRMICSYFNDFIENQYVTDANLSIDSIDISIPDTIPDSQEVAISTGAASDLTLDQALDQILAAIAEGQLAATKEIAEAGTATGEGEVVTPVEESMPVIAELGLPELGETLTTRFPFSIPWDVARAVRLLAAPPKTPRFEVDFMAPIRYRFGGNLGDTTVVLDFEEYAIIGQVSRWASTIGFCLLLASGTKKLIWTA